MLDNKKALTGKNLPEMTKFENEAKVKTWFSKVYHQVFQKNCRPARPSVQMQQEYDEGCKWMGRGCFGETGSTVAIHDMSQHRSLYMARGSIKEVVAYCG